MILSKNVSNVPILENNQTLHIFKVTNFQNIQNFEKVRNTTSQLIQKFIQRKDRQIHEPEHLKLQNTQFQ